MEAPTRFEDKFGMGDGAIKSRVTIALTQETEAVKVVVTNDDWRDDDPAVLAKRRWLAANPFTPEDTSQDGKDVSTALISHSR